MASEIRVNQIQSRTGVSTISFTETGPIISGVTTITGDLDVTGLVSYDDVTNIDSVGVVTARSDISIADKIVHTGDTNTAIRFPAADTFTVETGGSERFRIDSTGNTLIYGVLRKDNVNSSLSISGGNGADSSANIVLHGSSGSPANVTQFRTGTTERLRISSGGNVGINEINPERRLHINSGSTDTALKLESTDAEVSLELADNTGSSYIGGGGNYLNFYSGGNERIRVDSSGCLRVGNTHSQTTSSNTKRIALGAKANIWGWTSGNINGALTLADNYYWDGANNRAIEADNAAYLSLRSGSLRFGTTDSTPSAGGVTGLSEKFRVDTSGNLLLGQGNTTASDLAGGFTKRLSVEGTGAANSSIGLTRNANDDNPPYIYLGKSRGTSAGSNTVISNGDTIGMVNFAGSRGSGAFGDAVNLRAYAEANFSGSSSPGRFSVWTTAVNSTSPLESFRVNSAGAITAPRNVAWSYRRTNNGASWGTNTGLTYSGRQYRSPLPLFGSSATDYDTHNALSTFTSGSGTGIKFTAPVGGKYMVILNMTSVKNNTNADWGSIGLMVNTTAQASTGSLDYMIDTMYYPDVSSTNNQLGWGGSVIISLSANDYIVPYTMSVENFSSDNQYYFQGYLLG
jgi:hypothetical protein